MPNFINVLNDNSFIYISIKDPKYNRILYIKEGQDKFTTNNTRYNFINK